MTSRNASIDLNEGIVEYRTAWGSARGKCYQHDELQVEHKNGSDLIVEDEQ
jgi:hypothetical protein